MESVATSDPPVKTEANIPQANNNNESVVNFQKFIYELFEKNGVLNDLRAYLRSHIVDVIKNAQTGDAPACQKHFTQRLELTYQALNILIVEYLICLEFSFSLSVFVSEIPLANMVFDFAQTLFQSGDSDHLKLRFSDNDVWSILNYLGVKCDSVHASKIVDTYRNEGKSPLLLCILQCMPLYDKETASAEQVPRSENSSSESIPSTANSSDFINNTRCTKNNGLSQDKCKHYVICKTCQAKLSKIKDKYKRKKKTLCKNIRDTAMNPFISENLMKNISAAEKILIDEMFQQLKAVYEAEIEMVKKEEEKKIKRSLASHAMQLQKHQDELDEAFRVREEELERNVQQKKKFLWGLAKALREQHTQMSRAMNAVKNETERLSAKENSLKIQSMEAESLLRRRGEDLRSQISNELAILEEHLESMKRERDSIHKERREFENYKTEYDSKLSINNDMKSHYDLLKNELGILKKYIESTKLEPKCVTERSTLTELCDVTSKINIILNNEQDADRNLLKSDSEDRVSRAPNQVVNNLKKHKNVNFSNPHFDITYQDHVSNDCSRSPTSINVGSRQPLDGTLLQLQEENHRLKTFARQQRHHIDDLNRQQARLQSELTAACFRADSPSRPRTAPSVMPQSNLFGERLDPSANANCFGWRKGAGEEFNIFSNSQPHVLVPGDVVPFVGVLRDRPTNYRRHMISQWRSLRRRPSPLVATRLGDERPRLNDTHVQAGLTEGAPEPTQVLEAESTQETSETYMQPQYSPDRNVQRPHTAGSMEVKTTRDKSPKSVLREAKQKLKNKDKIPRNLPHEESREKSPSSVLREAKLRLRKLEIEAEAVEKSYLDFKKRQIKNEGWNYTGHENNFAQDIGNNFAQDIGKLNTKRNRTILKLNENRLETDLHSNYISTDNQQSIKNDFEKYISNYQTKFNITTTPAAKRSAGKTKLIYETHSKTDQQDDDIKVSNDYLETPLTEFRKLYHTQESSMPFRKSKNLGIAYPDAEEIETTRNRENIAPNKQELFKASEKVNSPTTKQSFSKIENLGIAYTNAEKIETSVNRENIAPSREESLNVSEKVDSARTNDNTTINDQVPTSLNPEHVDSERNNARNIVITVYSEAESNKNNKGASNKSEILNSENNPATEADNDTQIDRQAELEILKDNLSKIYNLHNTDQMEPITTVEHVDKSLENEIKQKADNNNLIIEIESVTESNNLKMTDSQPQELLLVVQSSLDTRNMSISELEEKERISTQMTVIASPTSLKGGQTQSPRKSLSPCSIDLASGNQQSKLTQHEILDDISQSDANKLISSTNMQPEEAKEAIEDSIGEYEKGDDDFSADVDNYNSRSEYDNSPISLPKTSEDENFWDS